MDQLQQVPLTLATTGGVFTGTSSFGANTTYATTATINYCIKGVFATAKTAVIRPNTPFT